MSGFNMEISEKRNQTNMSEVTAGDLFIGLDSLHQEIMMGGIDKVRNKLSWES